MNYKYKITVFTPVYNRANLLNEVYTSIVMQNIPRHLFEWLVIDDGSTENIKSIIDGFIQDNKINIRYFHKENGGVHTAWNFAVNHAEGEFFFRCDTDDKLYANGLSNLLNLILLYRKQLDSECVGIVGLCADLFTGDVIGSRFPESPCITTGLEMGFKLNCSGERAGCMRTDILKNFLLPEPPDTKFMFDTHWLLIDRHYKSIFVNELFKYYRLTGSDSISVSLSKKPNKFHCTSWFYRNVFLVNNIFDYMLYKKLFLLKTLINVTRRGLQAERNIVDILKSIDNPIHKFLVFLFIPIALLLYIRDELRSE